MRSPRHFLTEGDQRDHERRAENRRVFFERRERAAAMQSRNHLSIVGRQHLLCGNQALGIELADLHRWRL